MNKQYEVYENPDKKFDCDYCNRTMKGKDLNGNAMIHHGAKDVRCKNRKECERVHRTNKRKSE